MAPKKDSTTKTTKPKSKATTTQNASPKSTAASSTATQKPATAKKSTAGKKSSSAKKKSGSKKGMIAAAATGVAAVAAAAGVAFFRATKDNTPGGRKVYHVSPKDDGWEIKGQGADRAVSSHSTKKEALTAARELAHNQVPSQLVVHKSDGTIQESWSYDADSV